MALDGTRLKNAIKAGILAALARYDNVDNDERLLNYTMDDFWDDVAEVIGTEVVTEITGNAACNGTDSHGDTHNTVGIV